METNAVSYYPRWTSNEADKGWLLKLWQTRVVYLHAGDGEEAR